MAPYTNILLVDDDIDDADLFREALDSLNKGIIMQWDSSPEDALIRLKDSQNLPELIFMDYNMPRINGIEMLGMLKKDKRLCNIPVILISTPAYIFMKHQLEDNSVYEYIRKPNNFCELIAVLDSIL